MLELSGLTRYAGHDNIVVSGVQQDKGRAALDASGISKGKRKKNDLAGGESGHRSGSVVDRIRGCVPGAELLSSKPFPRALVRRVARVRDKYYDPGNSARGQQLAG